MGTLKNIPAGPQIIPQNTKFINIANVDMFNVFPVNFGSIMFPKTISMAIKEMAVNNGKCHVSLLINAKAIGNAHDNIEPMVGI